MENYFGFALKKVAEDIMDIFNGKLVFFTVVVLYNYGESFHIKVNLWTCFVFGLLEYCAHDIIRYPFHYLLLPQGKTVFIL